MLHLIVTIDRLLNFVIDGIFGFRWLIAALILILNLYFFIRFFHLCKVEFVTLFAAFLLSVFTLFLLFLTFLPLISCTHLFLCRAFVSPNLLFIFGLVFISFVRLFVIVFSFLEVC